MNSENRENINQSTRTTVFDTKFCIPINEEASKRIAQAFNEGTFVSFDELCEFAHTIKVTDEQKPNYNIIELSFLVTNKNRHPLVMKRGDARLLKKGYSVLYSFTPTHLNARMTISNPHDLLDIIEKNYEIKDRAKLNLKLIGIAHNTNIKKFDNDEEHEINYYFIIFEMAHPGEEADDIIRSRELDDVNHMYMPWHKRANDEDDELFKSVKNKPVDLRVLDHVYGTTRPEEHYKKSKFIPNIPQGDDEGDLHAAIFHRFDLFVSHASEDKHFVGPFVEELKKHGLKVWYDDHVLEMEDKLSHSIQRGIQVSRYGVVVLSDIFLKSVGHLLNWSIWLKLLSLENETSCFPFGWTLNLENSAKAFSKKRVFLISIVRKTVIVNHYRTPSKRLRISWAFPKTSIQHRSLKQLLFTSKTTASRS